MDMLKCDYWNWRLNKKSKGYDEETFMVHPTVLPEEVRGC